MRHRGTGLIAADPAAASYGFTLFAPLTGTGQVYLVDLNGVSVHRWDLPCRADLVPDRDRAAATLFPAPANAIFRAYRYTASDQPWLSG